MPRFDDFGSLIGRILIAAYFIPVGWRRVNDFEISVASNIERGLPVPEVLSITSFVVPVGAGLALLFGLKTVAAAILLIVFTALWSPMYHDFWNQPDATYMRERLAFFRNMALVGGLFMYAGHGAGRYSLDGMISGTWRPWAAARAFKTSRPS